MNMFAALETPLTDEPWHIDPRDRDPRSEDERVAAALRMAHMICPAVDIVAIPNAGRRSRWEANARKREGMKAGALDWVVTWRPHLGDRGVAYVEWKDGTGTPDANQRDRLNMLFRMGHHVGVFRREDSFFAWLRALGAPFVDRVGRL
ncbi:hypothetical protein [Sphingomonas turrisvirgatae]|uniref:VRR-NUC domain-containing protein n=1 Tax=Sphingomonas turrisvirgatae TaxID=1888892 RepID=A0A1E3LZS1_9SPHN|nr:hypothetical protein [Sphingomonas turrisvirgatae]ODP39271.1 hypothetical protein BFL28_10685 [Sphingomonas turrisvirgatae]